MFPKIDVGGAPEALKPMLEKHGRVFDAPRAHCDKARAEFDKTLAAVRQSAEKAKQKAEEKVPDGKKGPAAGAVAAGITIASGFSAAAINRNP